MHHMCGKHKMGGEGRERERERERERNLFALSLLKHEGTVCFEVAWEEACDRWDYKSTKLDFIGYIFQNRLVLSHHITHSPSVSMLSIDAANHGFDLPTPEWSTTRRG